MGFIVTAVFRMMDHIDLLVTHRVSGASVSKFAKTYRNFL